MARKSVELEKDEEAKERKEKQDMTSEEVDSLENDKDVKEDVDEKWHTTTDKRSDNATDDWAYIDDGFDEEMKEFDDTTGNQADVIDDIKDALATWRDSLDNNMVMDDLMSKSQDVPSATAFGDMISLIDDFDNNSKGWGVEHQNLKRSLKHLKGVATRINESMMKTCAECYSEIDEQTTYRDLTEIARDPVGYKLKKVYRRQNKRIFERLNTYDDTIRGEKNMDQVISIFMPQGQGDEWTTEEEAKCKSFIEDYASKDAVRRRPHLTRITNQMFDLAISLEMYTQDYFKDNLDKVAFFMTQLSYFEDVRNDPVNADFFYRLPEQDQKKLDMINRIATSFTPADFAKNVDHTLKRDDTYKVQGEDEHRLSTIMQKGGVDQVATAQMWGTKLAADMYKKDRRD
ncbi:MAG: hypothetical protein J6N76_10460 [Lachnospiraceae bacterium]|nr:hypothetical protein [Lachnospiraceae bacterium]